MSINTISPNSNIQVSTTGFSLNGANNFGKFIFTSNTSGYFQSNKFTGSDGNQHALREWTSGNALFGWAVVVYSDPNNAGSYLPNYDVVFNVDEGNNGVGATRLSDYSMTNMIVFHAATHSDWSGNWGTIVPHSFTQNQFSATFDDFLATLYNTSVSESSAVSNTATANVCLPPTADNLWFDGMIEYYAYPTTSWRTHSQTRHTYTYQYTNPVIGMGGNYSVAVYRNTTEINIVGGTVNYYNYDANNNWVDSAGNPASSDLQAGVSGGSAFNPSTLNGCSELYIYKSQTASNLRYSDLTAVGYVNGVPCVWEIYGTGYAYYFYKMPFSIGTNIQEVGSTSSGNIVGIDIGTPDNLLSTPKYLVDSSGNGNHDYSVAGDANFTTSPTTTTTSAPTATNSGTTTTSTTSTSSTTTSSTSTSSTTTSSTTTSSTTTTQAPTSSTTSSTTTSSTTTSSTTPVPTTSTSTSSTTTSTTTQAPASNTTTTLAPTSTTTVDPNATATAIDLQDCKSHAYLAHKYGLRLPATSIHYENCPKGCNAECDPCLFQTGCIVLDTFQDDGKICTVFQEAELTKWIKPAGRNNNCLKAHPVYTRGPLKKCCDGEITLLEAPGPFYEFTDDLIYYLGDGGATYNETTGKVDYTLENGVVLPVQFGSCVGGQPSGCCGNTTPTHTLNPLVKPKISETCRKTIDTSGISTGYEPNCRIVTQKCPKFATSTLFVEGLEIGYRGSDFIIPNWEQAENITRMEGVLQDWLEFAEARNYVSPVIKAFHTVSTIAEDQDVTHKVTSIQIRSGADLAETYSVSNTCDFPYKTHRLSLMVVETNSLILNKALESRFPNYHTYEQKEQLRQWVTAQGEENLYRNNIYPSIMIAEGSGGCFFTDEECKTAFCPPACKTIGETTTPDYG